MFEPTTTPTPGPTVAENEKRNIRAHILIPIDGFFFHTPAMYCDPLPTQIIY